MRAAAGSRGSCGWPSYGDGAERGVAAARGSGAMRQRERESEVKRRGRVKETFHMLSLTSFTQK